MRSLTCIVCPIGCSLSVEEDANGGLIVSGNKCQRGSAYAEEEIKAPKRIVTATCKVSQSNDDGPHSETRNTPNRRIPVKSTSPCPKEKIDGLLKDIYNTVVTLPVKTGDIIISDWKGSGIDIAVTRTME